MLEPLLLLPLLPGVQCNGTASQDSVLYQQFLSGEHGMLDGIPNLALFAMVVGPLLLLLVVACLVKRHKEKNKNEVKEIDNPMPAQEEEAKQKKNGDIFEEIESEMQAHEDHKKKLGKYLKFLTTRDGGNIARTNAKRMKKRRGSDEDSEDSENEEERVERTELQRQHLAQQLKDMLQSKDSKATQQQHQFPPPILD